MITNIDKSDWATSHVTEWFIKEMEDIIQENLEGFMGVSGNNSTEIIQAVYEKKGGIRCLESLIQAIKDLIIKEGDSDKDE